MGDAKAPGAGRRALGENGTAACRSPNGQRPTPSSELPPEPAERALDLRAGERLGDQDPDQRYVLGVRGQDLLAVEFMAAAEDGSPISDLRADDVSPTPGFRQRLTSYA